jgi:hypothetical protein
MSIVFIILVCTTGLQHNSSAKIFGKSAPSMIGNWPGQRQDPWKYIDASSPPVVKFNQVQNHELTCSKPTVSKIYNLSK